MNTESLPTPETEAEARAVAWALGQLDATESAAFEREMAASPALAAYAAEMRAFTTLVAAEFPADPESRLDDASWERVAAALTDAKPKRSGRIVWIPLALTGAAAAAIALTMRPIWEESKAEALTVAEAPAPPREYVKANAPLTSVSYSQRTDALRENDAAGSDPRANSLADTRAVDGLDRLEAAAQDATPAGAAFVVPAPTPPPVLASAPAGPANQFGLVPEDSGHTRLSKLRAGAAVPAKPASSATLGLELARTETEFRSRGVLAERLADQPEAKAKADSDAYYRGFGDQSEARGGESFKGYVPNPFLEVTAAPLSTFSVDVDTASYSIVRRDLNQGQRPAPEAVRLEELVNYFPYAAEPPTDGKPFAVNVETTAAPWNPAHRLARVTLKGKEVASAQRPAGNFVFLVDVSGSMNEPNKLPLVQQSLRMLAEQMTDNDRVSIVTYAGSSGVALPSTGGQEKKRILAAIDALQSGGGTNGAGGITAAYEQAAAHFIREGVNRVILATDGDFNVGVTSHEQLLSLIQEKAKTGVFLSVLGYGGGNLKDDTMELLADKGNGNYAYIDSLSEARKALVDQMTGTLVTIAKDAKIQIEFNPAAVRSYKLLGYENRLMAKEDFSDDKKDAGEIGAGHTVTALYELVPAGAPDAPAVPVVDGLKYQRTPAVIAPKPEVTPAALDGELMTVKLRWKQPQGETSELMEVPVKDSGAGIAQAGPETRWAAAVAGFALLLRGDAPPALTWNAVRELARGAKGADPLGYRGEFLQLIDKAEGVAPSP